MTDLDIGKIEKDLFSRGNPLKKLLEITLDLLNAEQIGVLYGTDETSAKFLPTSEWDRGVMDRFDGRGGKGLLLKFFGTTIVTLKKLSPVYFFQESPDGKKVNSDGVISYMLRHCADYYRQGISIIFSPDISGNIYRIDNQYAEIPFYSYNGQHISEPDIKVRVDLNIIKHFQAKNYISIYIPDYGIMVVNTADPELLARTQSQFSRADELKKKFDILIRLVEAASLALLGQIRGNQGAKLLWLKEKQLRRTSRELLENEKKYRDLYENAPVAYFSMDIKGIIKKCNYNTLKLTGYERDELIGRNVQEFYVDDEGKTTTPIQVLERLNKGLPTSDIEMRFRNKKQHDVWISISLEAVREIKGRICEVRAMALDISERKSLERQLLNAQKMEAIGTLAGGIAHDFNNILSPISGYSELLLMEAEEKNNERKKQLRIIHDCAEYAKGLVNQILTFSRQKGNEFKLLQPHVFVEDALSLTRSFIPATIIIKTRINTECGNIMVDPIQVHQVIMNLISNAYHAMEKSGGTLEISLDQAEITDGSQAFPLEKGEYICLEISDTGTGMPPEILERIFDPFFTTKSEGKGSGIGLSVVHGIVQSHKGYIHVESEPGKGARFKVYLPVYKGEIEIENAVDQERPLEKGDEHILLVDDNKKVAFMIQHMLETLGYEVTCHIDSPGALESFKSDPKRFDLVMTDLTMPDMTGYQLACEMTKIRSDIPIILCTGFGEHINKKEYSLKGIRGFLNKPVSVKRASVLIRDILDSPEN